MGLRWDHALIARIVPERASVLDLGCGGGGLLRTLMDTRGVTGQGIDSDPACILDCVRNGVPAIQADLDDGLPGFLDRSYDFVVLEKTLQTVRRPLYVLGEMLRVGRTCIVSFPNFGHWRIRSQVLFRGRMPVTPHLPDTWWATKNIHLLTVRDFELCCKDQGISIVARFGHTANGFRTLGVCGNLWAEEVLYVIAK